MCPPEGLENTPFNHIPYFGKTVHSAPPPANDGLLLWLRDPQNIPDKWSYYLLLAM